MKKLLDGQRFFVLLLILGLVLAHFALRSDIHFQITGSFGFKIEPTPYVIEATPTRSSLPEKA